MAEIYGGFSDDQVLPGTPKIESGLFLVKDFSLFVSVRSASMDFFEFSPTGKEGLVSNKDPFLWNFERSQKKLLLPLGCLFMDELQRAVAPFYSLELVPILSFPRARAIVRHNTAILYPTCGYTFYIYSISHWK